MNRKINRCEKCDGEGWLWWFELNHYSGPAQETGEDDTRYPCDLCFAASDPEVVMLGFDPRI